MQGYSTELLTEVARNQLCHPMGMATHITIIAVVMTLIGILVSKVRGGNWREDWPDFLVGGFLSGIVMVLVFCAVVLR